MTQGLAVLAEGLVKRFRKTDALSGLNLSVPEGSIVCLLGPNGAGKTTTVRILATLLRADAGRAEVAGFDVGRQPDEVRRRIALTGQYAALDDYLTGRQNLELVARLAQLPAGPARQRTEELLERFDLVEAASRPVKGYSGGMRRRLDLAASLVASPPVLFLDEPTTGLDPRSRLTTWETISELEAAGKTVLLTTQNLEEADRMAQQILVVDRGRVVAEGTPDALKARVGSECLEITPSPDARLEDVPAAIKAFGVREPRLDQEQHRIILPVAMRPRLIADVVRALDQAGIDVDDIVRSRPTLDDVFLTLTGSAKPQGPHEPLGQRSQADRTKEAVGR